MSVGYADADSFVNAATRAARTACNTMSNGGLVRIVVQQKSSEGELLSSKEISIVIEQQRDVQTLEQENAQLRAELEKARRQVEKKSRK
jgi:hypothetical protein